jgi:hypothetical protein
VANAYAVVIVTNNHADATETFWIATQAAPAYVSFGIATYGEIGLCVVDFQTRWYCGQVAAVVAAAFYACSAAQMPLMPLTFIGGFKQRAHFSDRQPK